MSWLGLCSTDISPGEPSLYRILPSRPFSLLSHACHCASSCFICDCSHFLPLNKLPPLLALGLVVLRWRKASKTCSSPSHCPHYCLKAPTHRPDVQLPYPTTHRPLCCLLSDPFGRKLPGLEVHACNSLYFLSKRNYFRQKQLHIKHAARHYQTSTEEFVLNWHNNS